MTTDQMASLREHLLYLLKGGGAHLNFDKAIADLPAELRGAKPPGVPHTPWRLLEHLRIAQRDILEFTRDPRHVSPPWPEGYWPAGDAPPDDEAWDRSAAAFRADLRAMRDLVADPATDLFTPLPHGEGQTALREALLEMGVRELGFEQRGVQAGTQVAAHKRSWGRSSHRRLLERSSHRRRLGRSRSGAGRGSASCRSNSARCASATQVRQRFLDGLQAARLYHPQ